MRRKTGVPEGESIYPYVMKYDPPKREEALKEVLIIFKRYSKVDNRNGK